MPTAKKSAPKPARKARAAKPAGSSVEWFIHDCQTHLTVLGIIPAMILILVLPAWGQSAGDLAAIEADWRKQDGIGTALNPATYAVAIPIEMERGDALLRDLQSATPNLADLPGQWEKLGAEYRTLAGTPEADGRWQDLWRRVHEVKRKIAFRNPLAATGPVLFVKQVPGSFSHQLTQVYGKYARPGGGIFILESPGTSLACRQLVADPLGSYQTPEVSYDGRQVFFAYCTTDASRIDARYYHLYSMGVDGTGLRQLTAGPYDDFSPRLLPDGRIVFVSTRRGGFHRCGSPGCPVYTLAVCGRDGGDIRQLSHHETQEWDPAILHDGRIIYTRWDYVDRHAVFGEHLWATRPDGTAPAAWYGNYTRNPVGIWEAQPVPGSRLVMATAAAHHAMTAGAIVLVDPAKGSDGPAPLTRLTPQTPFPESEFPVLHRWHFPAADAKPANTPENLRWPGHCYRSPWPLSEKYFIAAYSFDPLVGEPACNAPNMFGLYLVDCFGNKELLHRDPAISSLWPVPLRSRPSPPVLPTLCEESGKPEGTFVLQDVYASSPAVPRGSVKRLRITQVLPKTTQGRDNPPVGMAGGSPGKQVLGTVPVEADGSAHFTAPAGIPLLFQALDETGQAVQIMRSATYLQPGETAGCIGCHELRTTAPADKLRLKALSRQPSAITLGPDGSKPFSYPILVQGILDKHCVSCHNAKETGGKVNLTGSPERHYTFSYNALAARVPWSSDTNNDALSTPGRYGARGSSVMTLVLKAGHYKVALSADEIERLATWMDTNALFYGTFDPADQKRQQQGQGIDGPKLE